MTCLMVIRALFHTNVHNLGGRHMYVYTSTHTYMHTDFLDKRNFKKPGTPLHTWFKIATTVSIILLTVTYMYVYSYSLIQCMYVATYVKYALCIHILSQSTTVTIHTYVRIYSTHLHTWCFEVTTQWFSDFSLSNHINCTNTIGIGCIEN